MRITTDKAMTTTRSGQQLFRIVVHVNVNRYTHPHTEKVVAYPEVQFFKGKRKHRPSSIDRTNEGRPTFLFNGNWAPSWFSKRKQAQKMCDEILAGLHNDIVAVARDYDYEMDHLDEAFGIDRGLGTITEEEDE